MLLSCMQPIAMGMELTSRCKYEPWLDQVESYIILFLPSFSQKRIANQPPQNLEQCFSIKLKSSC